MPPDTIASPGLERQNFILTATDEQRAPDAGAQPSSLVDADQPWKQELMVHFLRNQLRSAPAMPLLSVLLAITSLLWVPATSVLIWLTCAVGCQMIQIHLCNRYFLEKDKTASQTDWIGMLTASELLQGVCWVMPLFMFWPVGSVVHGVFLISAIMVIIAVRLLVVNSYVPILIAGTGIMTIGIAVRCIMSGEIIYLALAGVIITLEFFFLFIAKQLHDTARDMVIFKLQKDELIVQLQQERDKAQDERAKAEDANKAKSAFLANMSHELRTPLNAIMGFSEILESEMLGPMQNATYKDYAGDIHNSGRYLLALINDILDLSRIEAGRRDIVDEPFYLTEQVSDAVHLLKDKANARSITVTQVFASNLPKIMGDSRAAYQIAINLLTNAIKFTPVGGIVSLNVGRNSQGGISFIVRDNGPGIPAQEIEHALSAFSRGSLATKKAIDGAGLGLPIVKGLIELHNGTPYYLDIACGRYHCRRGDGGSQYNHSTTIHLYHFVTTASKE